RRKPPISVLNEAWLLLLLNHDRRTVLYLEKNNFLLARPVFLEYDVATIDAIECGFVPDGFFELRAVVRIPTLGDDTFDQLFEDIGQFVVVGCIEVRIDPKFSLESSDKAFSPRIIRFHVEEFAGKKKSLGG